MAVQLANRRLGLRRQLPAVSDGHGDAPSSSHGPMVGPHPGRASEADDVPRGNIEGRTWVLALDPALWPVGQYDVVEDADTGQRWLVTTAKLEANHVDPIVNYVRVEAHLQTQEGTRP